MDSSLEVALVKWERADAEARVAQAVLAHVAQLGPVPDDLSKNVARACAVANDRLAAARAAIKSGDALLKAGRDRLVQADDGLE